MRVYDTLTGSHVELPPPPEPIGMYVCGPTVYQRAHIGNARPFVVFSWLASWLREQGHPVTFVHNVTDVNDRIYEAAPGKSAVLAREATAWYLEDTGDLGLGLPDEMPLATQTIPEIVALIEELVESGYAYPAEGDVYYRVSRFPDYGRLSRQRLDQVEQGEEPSPLKEDPRDFALWKATKPGEDTSWDSPWGSGRPGWHIECSAMAEKTLGPEFLIHGGGLDLVFPHHENEIAQSQAVGRPFARIWMHNGMLEFGGDEMHKSLGNDVSLRHVLDTWGREAVLVYFLTGHWHGPLDFSDAAMAAASARAERFREVFRNPHEPAPSGAWERFSAALEDDFNTPAALAVMHEWRDHELLRRALNIFGLESLSEQADAPREVAELAERRQKARAARDFDEADRLRAEIEAAGWEARDGPGGYRLVRRS
jgi:cysteinyl-tRNA synthetase